MSGVSLPFELTDIERELCDRSLHDFVSAAWRVIEPREFVDGWHIGALCEHLEAVSAGQLRFLIINVPPRHTKSLTTGVFWPAWEWGPNNKPKSRFMCSSYASALSTRDAVRCRRLMTSSWYQERWGDRFKFTGDQNAKQRYDNDKGGYRVATSVDGLGTGEGGDYILADDPNNIRDVAAEASRTTVNEWWDACVSTRNDSPKKGAMVVIQQRCHVNDLTGHILENMGEDYQMLVMPAEWEGKQRSTTGWRDPRTEEGQLLWPEQFDQDSISKLKRQLGKYALGQLQQRPTKVEGEIFHDSWFQRYEALPEKFDAIVHSWDMAFKDSDSSSYVAGQVWGMRGADYYLIDERRKRMDFPATLRNVVGLRKSYPGTQAIYVEDKANGPAVISTLKKRIPGIIAVTPKGSKIARAHAISPDVESGNVYIPTVAAAPWITEWLSEVCSFPNGSYNDRTDAFTQAVSKLQVMREKLGFHAPPLVSLTRTQPLSGL